MKKLLISLSAIVMLLLGGCATTTSFKSDVEILSSNQPTVFGKVEVFKNGKQENFSIWTGSPIGLLVQRKNSPETIHYNITDPGFFYWNLPPGEYMILGLLGQERTGPLRLHFTVPPGGKGLYIGDLVINFYGGYYTVDIKNNYKTGVEVFRAKFSGRQLATKMAIARKEKRLGTYKQVQPICSAIWGLKCTREYYGVKPVYPEGVSNIVVDNTTPILRWEPSSRGGITYDVVIYEEQKFARNEMGVVKDSLPGKRVYYAQGLTKTMLKKAPQLRPNTSYLWSVRLRRGQTVSTWSKFGFFNFYIVGWSSGYGQWFSFSTPEK